MAWDKSVVRASSLLPLERFEKDHDAVRVRALFLVEMLSGYRKEAGEDSSPRIAKSFPMGHRL